MCTETRRGPATDAVVVVVADLGAVRLVPPSRLRSRERDESHGPATDDEGNSNGAASNRKFKRPKATVAQCGIVLGPLAPARTIRNFQYRVALESLHRRR